MSTPDDTSPRDGATDVDAPTPDGKDPDAPGNPAATGSAPNAGDQEAGADAAARHRGGAGPRPSDDNDVADGGHRDDGDGGHSDERSLTPIQGAPRPQRPPRRTGVFVDPEDLRTHVGDLLRAILGGYEVDAFGNFTFTHEGARAFVTVGPSPIGPQVGVFSVTNLDLELTPPLAQFLLTTNHTLGFGAFSYDATNRAVWLRHTLHGSSLDLPELQSAVAAVATTAAALDQTIRDRFGGRTFQEAPDDVQRRMEPPETGQQSRPPNASGYL